MARGGSGNVVPSIVGAEHIGPDATGDNIEAKRVALYEFNAGTDGWQRKGAGYSDIRFDPNDSAPNYIGKNSTQGIATSDPSWTIYKFTYSGSDVTRIQKKTGAWDDRASIF